MRRFALVLALGIVAWLAPGPHASAQSGATDPGTAGASDESNGADEMAAWVKELDDARARLHGASERVEELENAKGRGAARRYPRGDAKEQYLADLQAARAERNDARRAFPVVVEDARRAGVPAGVLSDYEDEAEAALAAADDSESSDGSYAPENTDDDEYRAENTDDAEYRPANTDDAEEADPSDE